MRSNNPEALKNTQNQTPLPANEGPFVSIPTKNLLGYRGNEEIYKATVATLPQTFDGKPVPSFSSLDMRPRVEQLNPSPIRESLFPESQKTFPPTWETRPLVEILDGRTIPFQITPALDRAILIHSAEKKAS